MPARKGDLYLVGRTYVPKEGDQYSPRWHLLRWKRRAKRLTNPPWIGQADLDHWCFLLPGQELPACPLRLWAFSVGWPYKLNYVKRKWAYVLLCGSGKGWPAREIAYGMPTCKKCLRKIA